MVSPEALDWFEANLARPSPTQAPAATAPQDVRVVDVDIAGCAYRWCVPAAAEAETVVSVDAPWPAAVLYLPDTSVGTDPTTWAGWLASRSRVRVLVPTVPSEAAPARSVYQWLLADGGFDGQHVALVAEGSGAAAVLALLDRLVDDRRIADGPALVVLLSPWVDPDVADELGRDRGADPAPADPTDLRLGGDLVHTVAGLRGTGSALDHPAAASGPAAWRAQAAGAAAVHVGGSEVLIGDALLAARAFAAGDVPLTLRVWPFQQHGFHRPVGQFPEADLITDDVAGAIRTAVRE